MKKIVKLTESDLKKIVSRIINEQQSPQITADFLLSQGFTNKKYTGTLSQDKTSATFKSDAGKSVTIPLSSPVNNVSEVVMSFEEGNLAPYTIGNQTGPRRELLDTKFSNYKVPVFRINPGNQRIGPLTFDGSYAILFDKNENKFIRDDSKNKSIFDSIKNRVTKEKQSLSAEKKMAGKGQVSNKKVTIPLNYLTSIGEMAQGFCETNPNTPNCAGISQFMDKLKNI
jgi:hypothetical protein